MPKISIHRVDATPLAVTVDAEMRRALGPNPSVVAAQILRDHVGAELTEAAVRSRWGPRPLEGIRRTLRVALGLPVRLEIELTALGWERLVAAAEKTGETPSEYATWAAHVAACEELGEDPLDAAER